VRWRVPRYGSPLADRRSNPREVFVNE